MSYGGSAYGARGYGEHPDHDPPLVGDNLIGNPAYGRYGYGNFREVGSDVVTFTGALSAAAAALDAECGILVACDGSLASAVASVSGTIVLPPPVSHSGDIAADGSTLDGEINVLVGLASALAADDAQTDGDIAVIIGMSGITIADAAQIDAALSVLASFSGGIESGTAAIDAEARAFKRRRAARAIAH